MADGPAPRGHHRPGAPRARRPHFLGRAPRDHQQLVDRCLRAEYKFTGSFRYRALCYRAPCGVGTALWDLPGRATGQPVHALLSGAARTTIPMYASSMSREIGPQEEAARLAELVRREGFCGVKIKIGGRMGRDADASPGRTAHLIVAMREAVGPEVAINADANGAYTAHRAIAVGHPLERHGYTTSRSRARTPRGRTPPPWRPRWISRWRGASRTTISVTSRG